MTLSRSQSASLWSGPRFSPGFARLWRQVVLGLAIFHLVAQLVYWFPTELARTDTGRDTTVYFEASMRLKQGVDVYQPWPEYGVQITPSRFFYSPAFLLLIRPLAELPYHTFVRVWMTLILVAFWMYAACLGRLATGRWDWKSTLIFGLVADTVAQGHTALSIGQFEPFMWMLFGLALTTRNRAGCLALATLVKIHPMWALGLTMVEGGWSARRNAALFAVPVLLASLWLVGWHNWAMWWPSAQPVASQGTFNPYNISLSFMGLRFLSWCGLLVPAGTLPVWAKAYLAVCGAGAPLGVMLLARRLSRELRLALVACAGVLFAPLCWSMYLPLMMLPVAVWIGERRTQKA